MTIFPKATRRLLDLNEDDEKADEYDDSVPSDRFRQLFRFGSCTGCGYFVFSPTDLFTFFLVFVFAVVVSAVFFFFVFVESFVFLSPIKDDEVREAVARILSDIFLAVRFILKFSGPAAAPGVLICATVTALSCKPTDEAVAIFPSSSSDLVDDDVLSSSHAFFCPATGGTGGGFLLYDGGSFGGDLEVGIGGGFFTLLLCKCDDDIESRFSLAKSSVANSKLDPSLSTLPPPQLESEFRRGN